MNNKVFQWILIAMVVEMGFLHLNSAPGEFAESPIMGMFSIGIFLGSLLAAMEIYRRSTKVWVLSAFLASGSIIGYILSRMIGLPGMEVEDWFVPIRIISLVVEGIILILILWQQPWRKPELQGNSISLRANLIDPPILDRDILPVALLTIIILISSFAYHWDITYAGETQPMTHMTQISQSDLEQEYGLRFLLVYVSMMSKTVNARLKIPDAEKAQQLLEVPSSMPELLVKSDLQTMVMPGRMYLLGQILSDGGISNSSQIHNVSSRMELQLPWLLTALNWSPILPND